jgi:hypothetical protein
VKRSRKMGKKVLRNVFYSIVTFSQKPTLVRTN